MALEQFHLEALARGPPPVDEFVQQVVRSGQGQAALRALQQALAATAGRERRRLVLGQRRLLIFESLAQRRPSRRGPQKCQALTAQSTRIRRLLVRRLALERVRNTGTNPAVLGTSRGQPRLRRQGRHPMPLGFHRPHEGEVWGAALVTPCGLPARLPPPTARRRHPHPVVLRDFATTTPHMWHESIFTCLDKGMETGFEPPARSALYPFYSELPLRRCMLRIAGGGMLPHLEKGLASMRLWCRDRTASGGWVSPSAPCSST